MQSLSWKNLSPKSLGLTDGSDYYKGNIDTGALGGWLTDSDKEAQYAMVYLKAIANKYGREALYNLLMNGDDDVDVIPDDINVKGIRAMLGDNVVDDIMSDIDNPDLWKQVDVNDDDDAVDDSMSDIDNPDLWKQIDVNGDGDTDVTITDTNDNGKPDTAIITADSKKEQRDAIKAAKDKLNIDKQTSTGKTKKELDDQTLSDVHQKNVLKALLDCRF